MTTFSKHSFPFGVAAAALLLTLTGPRAVHAVTAALLLMANTVASPAIAQDTLKAASRSVGLVAFSGTGEYQLLRQVDAPGNVVPAAFAVPAGQSFVVTNVEITPSVGGAGADYVYLTDGDTQNFREYWIVPQSTTTQLQFPSGLVFVAGQTIGILAPPGAGPVYVYVHGYLTAD